MDKDELLGVFSRKATSVSPVLLESIQKFRGSHSLYEVLKYSLSVGGKRVRPVVLLLAGEALGGTDEELLPAAVSYELLHNFTLLHDDIINKRELRRGKPTVFKKFGPESAMVAGDLLFSLAYENLHKLSGQFRPSKVLTAFNYFNQSCGSLAQGQLKELELQSSQEPKLSEYYYAIDNRISSLFVGAMKTGALLASGADEQLDSFERYAVSFGRAFQIKDDILDLKGLPAYGKKTESDVKKGKRTILTIYAINHLEPKKRKEFLRILDKEQDQTSAADIAKAVSLIEESNALNFAEEEAQRVVGEGRAAIEDLPSDHHKAVFNAILDYALERDV